MNITLGILAVLGLIVVRYNLKEIMREMKASGKKESREIRAESILLFISLFEIIRLICLIEI